MKAPLLRRFPNVKAENLDPPTAGRRLGLTARALKSSLRSAERAIPGPEIRQAIIDRFAKRG
jgi:hypothetical protein